MIEKIKFNLPYLIVIIISLYSCNKQANNEFNPLKSPLTNFNWPIASPTAVETADVYIPFFQNSKYFITDGKENPISKTYDDIKLDSQYPFYWAKTSNKYHLYTYPEEKILVDGFESPQEIEFARSRINFVDNARSPFPYFVLKFYRKNNEFSPHYFFTTKSRNVSKSEYAPLHTRISSDCENRVPDGQPLNSKFLIVHDGQCQLQFIDNNGKAINKIKFSTFKRIWGADNFIQIETQDGSLKLFDYSRNKLYDFPYKDVKAVKGLDGYFNGRYIEPDSSITKLFINRKGEVLTNDQILSMPKGIEKKINSLNPRPINERDSLVKVLESTYPKVKNVKVSGCVFEKYYLVTLDDLQGIVTTKGDIALDFHKVKLVEVSGGNFLHQGINIYKGSNEYQLNENLELTRFPYSEGLNRLKIDTIQARTLSKAYKDWKLVHFIESGYLVFQGGAIVHVYKGSGEYISSHQGIYESTQTNYSLLNFENENTLYSNYIKIFRTLNNKEMFAYYVNVENGLEYKE